MDYTRHIGVINRSNGIGLIARTNQSGMMFLFLLTKFANAESNTEIRSCEKYPIGTDRQQKATIAT